MTKQLIFLSLIISVLYSNICIGDNSDFKSDSIRALELGRKGNEFGRQGYYQQSLQTHFESLNLRVKLYGDFSEKLGPAYMGIGNAYKNIGLTDLALKYYKLAEKSYGEKISRSLLVNIGGLYRNKLDYNNALKYYEIAIEIANFDKISTKQDIVGINYNIADIFYILNRYDEALFLLNNYVKYGNWDDQILYYDLLASIYHIKGEINQAKKYYLKSIKLTSELYGRYSNNISISYIKYANFLIENDQFADAKKILNEANKIIKYPGFSNSMILSDYCKSEGYWIENYPVLSNDYIKFKQQKSQNIKKAIEWYSKSLEALNFKTDLTNYTISDPEKCISLKNCIELLKLIADAYSDIDQLEKSGDQKVVSDNLIKSLDIYQIVGTLIQKARKEISNDESKIELTNLEYETFSQIIKTAYTAYYLSNDMKYFEMAFQNAEKLKSSSLYDKISSQLALENSLVPDSILEKEVLLNNSISFYNEKLMEENSKLTPDSLIVKEYRNEIFNLSRQREDLNRLIENEYKDFYELKYSGNLLSAGEIQQRVNAEQVLIEYFINETDSVTDLYTFVITKNGVDLKKQELSGIFLTSVNNMFQFMSNSDFLYTTSLDAKYYCKSANYLWNILIKPQEKLVKNKKITIIPDGLISYIPFDALIYNIPDTTKNIEFNQLDYLIKHYTFNYANSANLLFQKKATNAKYKVKAIAFAPEYKSGEVIEYAGNKIALIPLTGIQKEVAKIARLINTDVFTGDEATEENFRKNAEKYDILHLAMHAFINDSLPAFSSLAFSQTSSEDILKNGLLNTSEIYNLNIKARLTVLSACNTGIGKLRKGEGIMSLARGFLYAGCPSIIMSLWEVEDNSGTQIIASFYKNLKHGKAKDEALRLAKIEYLESVNSRMAHPHYWLGFVSIGDESPMYKSYDFYLFIILIIALAGVGADQLIRIKKARKKRAS